MAAVCTAYATTPLLAFLHPPIELASIRPRGRLNRDGWIDFSTICIGKLLHVVVVGEQPTSNDSGAFGADVITAIRDLAKMINQWLQLGPFRGKQRSTVQLRGQDLVFARHAPVYRTRVR